MKYKTYSASVESMQEEINTLRRQLAEAEKSRDYARQLAADASIKFAETAAKLALAEQEYADLIGDLIALLPGAYYMDPPDVGDLTVIEQVQRMASDAARYLWLRNEASGARKSAPAVVINPLDPKAIQLIERTELDTAIDAAIAAGEGE